MYLFGGFFLKFVLRRGWKVLFVRVNQECKYIFSMYISKLKWYSKIGTLNTVDSFFPKVLQHSLTKQIYGKIVLHNFIFFLL